MIGVDDDDDDDEGYFLVPSRRSVSAWGKTTAHGANQEEEVRILMNKTKAKEKRREDCLREY